MVKTRKNANKSSNVIGLQSHDGMISDKTKEGGGGRSMYDCTKLVVVVYNVK